MPSGLCLQDCWSNKREGIGSNYNRRSFEMWEWRSAPRQEPASTNIAKAIALGFFSSCESAASGKSKKTFLHSWGSHVPLKQDSLFPKHIWPGRVLGWEWQKKKKKVSSNIASHIIYKSSLRKARVMELQPGKKPQNGPSPTVWLYSSWNGAGPHLCFGSSSLGVLTTSLPPSQNCDEERTKTEVGKCLGPSPLSSLDSCTIYCYALFCIRVAWPYLFYYI